MATEPPSFHAANCRLDDCEWSTLRSSMIQIYADLEDHLKQEHGYTEEQWRESRSELAAGGAP